MSWTTGGGIGESQVRSLVSELTGGFAQLADVSTFVSRTPMTVAELLAAFPAGPDLLGHSARVTDLYGSVDEEMRCCASLQGTTKVYYWRPRRSDFARTSTQAGGAMSLTPLVTAPILFLTGTLSSALTLTPSMQNAWPGCTFEVVSQGALGMFGATIGGLLGTSVSLVTGGSKLVTFDGAGWRARP